MGETLSHIQHTLWTDALDNRGVLAQPHLPRDEHLYDGLHRVVSLEGTARHIGRLIAPVHFEGENLSFARELDVTVEDVANVSPSTVERSLYSPYTSDRFKGVSQCVRVYGGITEIELPGMVAPDIGVAFHEDDYTRLAHSAVYLGNHSKMNTLRSRPLVRNSDDRRERDRKSDSSWAKTMVTKVRAIDLFDAELVAKHDLFTEVSRGFRENPPIRYLPGNADSLLMKADAELRRIVETAGQQRKLTPEERASAQRALTYNLYERPNGAHIWRTYLEMGSNYFNAQRGKLNESRNACAMLYEKYRHSIKPEDIEATDAVIYGWPAQTELDTQAA